MSLAEAREKAQEAIRIAADGKDPSGFAKADRVKLEEDSCNTFGVLANKFLVKYVERKKRRPQTLKEYKRTLKGKLDELRARLGGLLSGGEQQMLTIGRTLMTNPGCLLLDEPTEGLAPIIVQQVVEAIKLLKSEGLAILISEQNRHMAATLADRVCVLEKGQIIYGGPIAAMPPQAHRALGW